MAFNPLDYLKNLVPENTNIFGASPNPNIKKMYDMGLLGKDKYEDVLNKTNRQSVFQGLLNTGLSYAAQPKNQGYGSIFPYLAKAGLAGVQAAQSPYDQMGKDAMMSQQLQEMKRQKEKRETVEAVLKDGLYKETTTGGELKEAYKPVTQKTYTPSGLVDTAVAPSFKAPEYTPTKTTYDFDLGQIQKLIQSNALPEAGALMNLEKARRELLKTNQTGMILTDEQAKSLGLRVDKNQKYFLNDKAKPELIQGQMLTDSEISKDDYQLVMSPEGTFYVPKQPSKTKVPLQLVEGGKYIERPDFTQYQDPDIKIFNKEQVMPMVLALQADYPNLDAENAVNVILQVAPRAYDYKKSAEGKRDPRNLYDIVKNMVVSQYNVSEKGIVFKEPVLTSKPEFKIGSIVEDASGKRIRITGFDNTGKPTYVEVQ
jgi:hypothetical protein